MALIIVSLKGEESAKIVRAGAILKWVSPRLSECSMPPRQQARESVPRSFQQCHVHFTSAKYPVLKDSQLPLQWLPIHRGHRVGLRG